MLSIKYFKDFLLIILLISGFAVKAQGNYTLFFEPELNLKYKITPNYHQGFSVENRNFIYNGSKFDYRVKHLEFAHESLFVLNDSQTIGIGLQYRFEENFEASEENEFRLLQEFGWRSNIAALGVAQRLRTEQRFYTSTTKYRLRYELQVAIPLQSNKKNTHLNIETESLYEIAKTQKPELEQRFGAGIGWQLNPKTEFSLGLEYRLADYTQDLGHELFLVTGFDISLGR